MGFLQLCILKNGKILILCKITLSDPVTYGTLEVMVDWLCSKCVQACPDCIYLVGTWTVLHITCI